MRLATSGVQANEVQTLTMSTAGGAATGGTFTLTFSGQTTGTIAYNASAATVQAALEALSNIAVGDITVTGSAAGPWTITAYPGGTLDFTDLAALTANTSLVTGPGSPYSMTITETQKGGYVGVVIGSDADRQRKVLTSDWLSQSNTGGENSDLNTSELDNGWIYVPDRTEQRPVADRGYVQSVLASEASDQSLLTETYCATVMVRRPWSGVLAANQAVEFHAKLPAIEDEMSQLASVRTILNRALSSMVFPKRIEMTGVSATNQYDVSEHTWLREQWQLMGVPAPETTSGIEPIPLRGNHRLRSDGQTRYLSLGNEVATGDTFWIDAWMPRSAWIKVDGDWAVSTAGLVNESDEADVDPDALNIVAYYYACAELALRGVEGERGSWAIERDTAKHAAAPYMAHQTDYDDPTTVTVRQGDQLRSVTSIRSYRVPSWPS